MKVALVQPPCCDPSVPPLGLAYLATILKKQGNSLVISELNLDFRQFIESESWLSECLNILKDQVHNNETSPEGMANKLRSDLALIQYDYLKNFEDLNENGKTEEKYYREIKKHQIYSLITSLVYPEYQINMHSMRFKYGWHDLNLLVSKAKNTPELFAKWLKKSDEIKKNFDIQPDWIGFSVTFESQFLPALIIAHYIKNNFDTTIIFGGGFFNTFAEYLDDNTPFNGLMDGVIVGAGERAFPFFFESNDEKKIIPPLEAKQLKSGIWLLDLRHLTPQVPPSPDFSDFPLRFYQSPDIVLPYRVFAKCQWNKCKFCADNRYLFHLIAEKGDAKKIVQELLQFSKLYSNRGIYFVDPEIPVDFLISFSNEMIKQKCKLKWGSNIRFSRELSNSEIVEKLYIAGCRLLRFGLESASKKILKLMQKGILPETASKVLKEVHSAGIVTHVYFMRNFPGEKSQDWQETVRFLLDHTGWIDMFSVSMFILYENSESYKSFDKTNSVLQRTGSTYWQYPTYKGAETVNKDSFDEDIKMLYNKFFLKKRGTKNCFSTADTILISDLFEKGIFHPIIEANQVIFCPHCRIRLQHPRSRRLLYLPAELAENIRSNESFQKAIFRANQPCLLTLDRHERLWQIPEKWIVLSEEISVKQAVIKKIHEVHIANAITRGICDLFRCPDGCVKPLTYKAGNCKEFRRILFPNGIHFDGYFEEN